jgi:arabinofuranan 3-O-arabinosyltransferase
MTVAVTHAEHPTGFHLTRPVELTCFALCVTHTVYLATSLVQGSWLVDPAGQAIATDFVNVWAAGRQVLGSQPTAVYDVALHKAAAVAAVGHPFDGHYPWIYPPTFLFPATLLALLPFLPAQLAWIALTFPAYAAAVRGIIGDRVGLLFACAFPGILANAMVGQNGFVTAALLGGALLFMQRRPLLAGGLIGLLSFKPHLGILFPLVLIAGGYWRVIGAAAVATAMLVAASSAVFGIDTWGAFIDALPLASQTSLTEGRADFAKLQSIFGLVRMFGGSDGLAWTLQMTLAAGSALLLMAMWRSKLSFDLKAAALVTGTLLCTPYLFIYDLVVLAVPMAFLLRGGRNGDVPGEMPGLAAAALLLLAFPLVKAPVGLAAIVVIAALIARRALLASAPDDLRAVRTA